ncbi:MAG TPA: DUF992 domain-containing protein [Pseudolabrys sp.]|jgi:hypothetical protein|nr:DUF992 domain-containing protein [Pseudolabrys sp.]
MRQTALALAVLGIAALAAPAQSQSSRIRVGALTCDVAPGVGLVVGSSRSMRCVYQSVDGWSESYSGQLTRVGVDIGVTDAQSIAWAVWAPVNHGGRGALAGRYGGASAEVTIAAGLGANVLIGGFDNSFMLQPVSVSAQTGANVAAGVTGLELTAQ